MKDKMTLKELVIFNRYAVAPNLYRETEISKTEALIETEEFSEDQLWHLERDKNEWFTKGYSSAWLSKDYNVVSYVYWGDSLHCSILGANWPYDKYMLVSENQALPETLKNIEEFEKKLSHLPSLMAVIEGDKSPFSYLQAVMIYRHIKVGDHECILPLDESCTTTNLEWIMLVSEPKIINPYFYYDIEGHPVIVLYVITRDALRTEWDALFEIKYIFNTEDYTFDEIRTHIATNADTERFDYII